MQNYNSSNRSCRLLLFSMLFLAPSLMAADCCCSQICVDVGANFTLDVIGYNPQSNCLFVSGYSSLSFCASKCEDPEDRSRVEATIELDTLELTFEAEQTQGLKQWELPQGFEEEYSGVFPSSCDTCTLDVGVGEERYLLKFTNDPETIQQKVEASGYHYASQLMSIYLEDTLIGEFAFDINQVYKLTIQ